MPTKLTVTISPLRLLVPNKLMNPVAIIKCFFMVLPFLVSSCCRSTHDPHDSTGIAHLPPPGRHCTEIFAQIQPNSDDFTVIPAFECQPRSISVRRSVAAGTCPLHGAAPTSPRLRSSSNKQLTVPLYSFLFYGNSIFRRLYLSVYAPKMAVEAINRPFAGPINYFEITEL